jgi:transposase
MALPDDPAQLKQMIRELVQALREQRQDNDQLRHRLDLLLRRVYGPHGQRFDPNQPLLFADGNTPAPPAPPTTAPSDTDDTAASAPKRKKHGRNQLPEHLHRKPVIYDLTEAERLCPDCGQQRRKIGEERSEQLDYEPASLYVIEHVRCTYACPHCQGQVVTAVKPPQPIAKGLPGPGLLAYVTVSKHEDHLPLYRLEHILARHGVELARSTLCDWMAGTADLLRPLYKKMIERILRSQVLHTDDTTLPVQDETRATTRTARLWAYLGDTMYPYNVFDYTPDRKREGPAKFLDGYYGYLQADAFGGYDGIYAGGKVHEVCCNAHARRKFFEARSDDDLRACQALAYYRRLYHIEDLVKDFTDESRLHYRQEQAVPILQEFHAWLKEQQQQVLPKSPIGQAISYALNQWEALQRYTTAGFLDIDNNVAEREMKRIATGRKNWLFVGSDAGGKTAAVLFSFTSTCRRHGIDAFVYLRDILTRLPTHPADRLEELLPDRWAEAQKAQAMAPPATAPPAEPPPTAPPPALSAPPVPSPSEPSLPH